MQTMAGVTRPLAASRMSTCERAFAGLARQSGECQSQQGQSHRARDERSPRLPSVHVHHLTSRGARVVLARFTVRCAEILPTPRGAVERRAHAGRTSCSTTIQPS